MRNYEATKKKAVDTLLHGVMAFELSNDHAANRTLINSIMDACRLALWMEDLQEAAEKGDLEGVRNAKTNNGF